MNKEELAKELKEILDLVKLCPSNLQEKCFELLFSTILDKETPLKAKKGDTLGKSEGEVENPETKIKDVSGSEIKLSDLHVKAKRFLEKGVPIEQINNIFYKEGSEFKPVYDHLKTTKLSESQIRVTLLEALRQGLVSGEFGTDTDKVKDLCEIYKCYDSPNYAATFKRLSELFNEEYKKGVTLTLSPKGKEKLVEIIKDLAS